MEGRPTPGIVRLPIPTGIRVEPASSIGVRAPAVVDDSHGRLPAQAVGSDLNPGAIRRQHRLKIGGRLGNFVDHGFGLDDGLLGLDDLLLNHNGLRLTCIRSLHHALGRRGDGALGLNGVLPQPQGFLILRRDLRRGRRLVDQRVDDRGRDADVSEVDQFVGRWIEGGRRVGNEVQDHVFVDLGLRQFDYFSDAGRQLDCPAVLESWISGSRCDNGDGLDGLGGGRSGRCLRLSQRRGGGGRRGDNAGVLDCPMHPVRGN